MSYFQKTGHSYMKVWRRVFQFSLSGSLQSNDRIWEDLIKLLELASENNLIEVYPKGDILHSVEKGNEGQRTI